MKPPRPQFLSECFPIFFHILAHAHAASCRNLRFKMNLIFLNQLCGAPPDRTRHGAGGGGRGGLVTSTSTSMSEIKIDRKMQLLITCNNSRQCYFVHIVAQVSSEVTRGHWGQI